MSRTIYSKTARGMREAADKSKDLPRDLRRILKAVDGKSDIAALQRGLGGISEKALSRALETLQENDYIRALAIADAPAMSIPAKPVVAPAARPSPDEDDDLDFTALGATDAEPDASVAADNDARNAAAEQAAAQAEAEAEARRLAEEKLRQEAEARLRAEIAAQAQAQAEAEMKERQAAEAEARRQAAEEQARRAAEERARQEAEAAARAEAERQRLAAENARLRQEAEQMRHQLKQEAQAVVPLSSAEQASPSARVTASDSPTTADIEAERQRLAAENERLRQEAEQLRLLVEKEAQEVAQARAQAEAQARREAEERERLAAAEKLRQEAEAARLQAEAEAQALRNARAAEAEKARLAAEKKRLAAEAKARLAAEVRAVREAEEARSQEAARNLQHRVEPYEAPAVQSAALLSSAEIVQESALKEPRATEEQRQTAAWPEPQQTDDGDDSAMAIPPPLTETPLTPHDSQVRRGKRHGWRSYWRLIVALLIVAAALVHLLPFDTQRLALEQAATASLGQPVKIAAMNFRLLPLPHWHLQDVRVGDASQVRIATVDARTSLSALFGDAPVTALEMTSLQLNGEGLAWALLNKPLAKQSAITEAIAHDVQIKTAAGALPAGEAKVALTVGQWQQITLATPDRKLTVELQATPDGGADVKLAAPVYQAPLTLASDMPAQVSGVVLKKFTANGHLQAGGFEIREFSGETYDGYLSGKASLAWRDGWRLQGEATARLLDAATLFPGLAERGVLSGKGRFFMQGNEPAALLPSLAGESDFLVERGTLKGIDLDRVLRDAGIGSRTTFTALKGQFVYRNGVGEVRNLLLEAGQVTARGEARMAADRRLDGHFQIDLQSPSATMRSGVTLAGTMDNPTFGH